MSFKKILLLLFILFGINFFNSPSFSQKCPNTSFANQYVLIDNNGQTPLIIENISGNKFTLDSLLSNRKIEFTKICNKIFYRYIADLQLFDPGINKQFFVTSNILCFGTMKKNRSVAGTCFISGKLEGKKEEEVITSYNFKWIPVKSFQ